MRPTRSVLESHRRRFPRGLLILLFPAALLLHPPAAGASEVSHARIVRLSYVQGSVGFREAGAAEDSTAAADPAGAGWQKAIANIPIREGMSLATDDGRAEVEFESGSVAWISSNTVLEFPQLALADGTRLTGLVVRQGTASFQMKAGRHDSFVIQAGHAQIRVPGSARFRVDVFDDGTSITSLGGSIDADAGGRLRRVSSKTTLSFRGDAAENLQVSHSPAPDGWDRWVADRSGALDAARFDSASYTGTGVAYGLADLSYYGDWVSLPGYGYGWQPWSVGAGWSPFLSGFWSNFGPLGPTWISYEPWGWLPYHYGGWVASPFYGWVWIPGNFQAWSPATVAWLRTPTGVGWVPLRPHEKSGPKLKNLAYGVVTNTPQGMAARSRNSPLASSSLSSVRVVGAWQNDAELARLTKEGQAVVRSQSVTTPRFTAANAAASAWRPGIAEKMPAGPAPRLAGAPSLHGTVPVYRPPAAFSAGHAPTTGWGHADSARSLGSPAGSSATHSGASIGAAPRSGSAGSSGSSGGSGKP